MSFVRYISVFLPAIVLFVVLITASNATAQSSLDNRVIEQLEKLESGSSHEKTQAAGRLLMVDPDSVSKEVRNRAARAFRAETLESRHGPSKEAVQGLVHWGGSYSTKVLIESFEKSKMRLSDAVVDALVDSNSPEAAETLATKLGDFFNGDEIEEALKQMGPVAEKPVIAMAQIGEEKQVLSAINILAEIGTEESEKLLKKVQRRGQAQYRGPAQVALTRIQSRMNSSGSSTSEVEYDSDDPFAEPITKGGSGLGGDKEGDWSQVIEILVNAPNPGSFQLDPVPSGVKSPSRCKAAKLAAYPGGMSGQLSTITYAHKKPERVSILTIDPFKKTPAMVQLIDVNRGRALNPVPIGADTQKADLSPDGKRIVAVAEEDKAVRIDIYELTPKETKLLASWRTFTDDKMWSTDMQWVRWLDDERFLTLNRKGDLVAWNINGAKAELRWSVDGWTIPTLSPGMNQIAVTTDEGIAIFDTKTGDTLAWLKDGPRRGGAIGFSQDGSKLAVVTGSRVRVWDLKKDKLIRDFHNKSLVRCNNEQMGSISFDGTNLVVRGSSGVDILSLKERRIIHRYTHSSRNYLGYDDYTFLASKSGRASGLFPNQTIAPDEWDQVEDPDSILAVKPGTPISVDVRVGGGLDSEARSFLEKAIEDAGLVLDPNALTRIVARKESKSESTDYRVIGGNPFTRKSNVETVNVTTNTYKVEMYVDGEVAWTYQRSQGGSHFLQAKSGESLQDASNRQTKASAGYFQGLELPRYLVHPKQAGPLTTSHLRY